MDLVKKDWHLFSIRGEYFLFHSLGSLYQLDRESYEVIGDILSGKKPKGESAEILEELNEVLTAVPDFYPEDVGELTVKSLCLNVSHSCNMSCDYCFASHNFSSTSNSLMTPEIAYKAVDFLLESSRDVKNIEIDFFGGEPLLNLETVKKSGAYARERAIKYNKNLRINLTTNGLLLDEDTLNILDDLDISIVLSLDGGKNIHDRLRHTVTGKGTFDYILPNAQRLAERRSDGGYYIRGTYTQKTLNFSESFKELMSFGFKYISLEPVVTKDPDLSIKEEHLPILRK
ncbi:MAG: radical SAM protein, partial [bacterium]